GKSYMGYLLLTQHRRDVLRTSGVGTSVNVRGYHQPEARTCAARPYKRASMRNAHPLHLLHARPRNTQKINPAWDICNVQVHLALPRRNLKLPRANGAAEGIEKLNMRARFKLICDDDRK